MPTLAVERDKVRIAMIRDVLHEHACDALVGSLPSNVLMLSGYWPVVGTSVVLACRDGAIHLIVPEDEHDLARRGWADTITTFHPSSLDTLTTAGESLRKPLHEVARGIGDARRIAYEVQESSAPASYAAMHLYRGDIEQLVAKAFPGSQHVSAQAMLQRLRERKSPHELEHLRTACQIAQHAFEQGASELRAGLTEVEAANLFRTTLSNSLAKFPEVARADGFVFCMSGPNSAEAFGAYARSRARKIEEGDLVLMHCNSYADGFWTDITRTYQIGDPRPRQREIQEAVFAARAAAFQMLVPGVTGAEVDEAARSVLRQRGFGREFKHSTGHGVGFESINANARPRLHPKSDDRLAPGMVFNVEPAIYIEGMGGIRHCDMAAITEDGFELLTPFQALPQDLVLSRR